MQKTSKMSFANYAAIFMLFFFANAGTFINSAVQACIDAWPDVPVSLIRMLTSLPGAFTVLSMIIVGSIVEKKISYRASVLLGCILILIGGAAPYFIAPSWTFVLIMRGMIGLGAGCLGIRNALLLKSTPEEKQTAFTGYGSVLFSLGFIVLSPLAGYLAEISWKHAFLVNLLILPIAVWNLLFLKEPDEHNNYNGEAQTANNISANANTEKMNAKLALYFAIMFISSVSIFSFHIGISTFFAIKNLGSAAAAGLSISAYFVGGFLMNAFLSKFQALLKGAILPAALLAASVGMAVILYLPSVTAAYIGGFISGCGYMTMFSILQVYNGKAQPVSKLALSSTLILVASQLGVFVCPYYINVSHMLFGLGTDVESAFLSCIICHVIAAALAVIFRAAPQNRA